MEYPWIVVGWENVVSEKTGKTSVRLYVERELVSESGFGKEAGRLFFNPEYVNYEPSIHDQIIAVEGRYGIDKIVKLGSFRQGA